MHPWPKPNLDHPTKYGRGKIFGAKHLKLKAEGTVLEHFQKLINECVCLAYLDIEKITLF